MSKAIKASARLLGSNKSDETRGVESVAGVSTRLLTNHTDNQASSSRRQGRAL